MARKSGFTLIEVVVGLAILVVLVGLVQGIYATTVRNREATTARTAMVHSASTVLGRIADELASAYVDPDRAVLTAFTLKTDGSGNSTLIFTTLLPPVHGLRVGGETLIRYEVRRDKENSDPNAMILSRTELSDPEKDLERDGLTYDMLKGITRFTVEVSTDDKWTDRFEADPGSVRKLPPAVRLEAAWGEKGEEVVRTATSVYSASDSGKKP